MKKANYMKRPQPHEGDNSMIAQKAPQLVLTDLVHQGNRVLSTI